MAVLAALLAAGGAAGEAGGRAGRSIRLDIGGIEREAIVWAPADARRRPAPVLLVFHGHGGSAAQAARRYQLHVRWPEAIVAYGQGLPTPSLYDPKGRKAGWQHHPGDDGDRDLAFVDALLARLGRDYRIDRDRVHAFGHSNGSRFVYVLWIERGGTFASFVTSSAQGGTLPLQARMPRAIFASAGERDPLVPYAWQLASIDRVRRVLETDPLRATVDGYLRVEPGRDGTALATYLHPGGHELPEAALPQALEFLQEHSRPSAFGSTGG